MIIFAKIFTIKQLGSLCKKLVLFSLLSYFLVVGHINAQNPEFKIVNQTVSNGLSQNNVFCLMKDSRGFLWIGTGEGLNRDNGYKFKTFTHKPRSKNSLSSNTIWCLHEDKLGNILIGTRKGLNIYTPKTEKFTLYNKDESKSVGLSDDDIRSIAGYSSTEFWIGTYKGLNLFNSKTGACEIYFHNKNDSNSISNNTIVSLLYDKKKKILWIGTRNGLNKLSIDKGKITRYYNNEHSIGGNNIRSIIKDLNSNIWIATENGITCITENDEGKEKINNYEGKNSKIHLKDVSVIKCLKGNRLFVGSLGTGAYIFDINKKEFVRNTLYLDNIDRVRCAYYKKDFLWIGTSDKGLIKIHLRKNLFNLRNIKDKNDNPVMPFSFYEDEDDIIWIGTTNGLAEYNRKSKEYKLFYIESVKKIKNTIRTIHKIDNNYLWLGTINNGLYVFDLKKKIFFKHSFNQQFPESNQIYTFFRKPGEVLLGCNNGTLYKYTYSNNKFIKYKLNSSSTIFSIYEKQDNKLLIATLNDGLWELDLNSPKNPNQYFIFDPESNISTQTLSGIFKSPSGKLLLTTFDGGLIKVSEDDGYRFTAFPDLIKGALYGLLIDNENNFWISTNKGLNKYSPNTKNQIIYHEDDGIQAEEFNTGALLKCKDGELFFGGVRGFNHFYPDSIIEPVNTKDVLLTDIKILNNPISPGDTVNGRILLKKNILYTDKIVLNRKDYYFSIHFTSIDFKNSTKLRYRFKLENYDKDWLYTDFENRIALYRNMPSGKYTFKVQVANYNNKWSNKTTSLEIIVEPAFWQTKYFYFSIAFILILFIFLIIRIREKKLKSDKIKLAGIIKDKTSELEEANEKLGEHKIHLEEIVNARTKELNSKMIEYAALNEEYQIQNRELKNSKEKAVKADKLKSAFLANMSHEIRTPMNSILGFSQLLKESKITNKQRKDFVKMINIGGESLLSLINDIIDIAKIEAGQLEIIERKFPLNDILQEIHSSFLNMPRSKDNEKVDINLYVPENTSPIIKTDRFRFKQVLNNLVSNALKFTREGAIEISYKIFDDNKTFRFSVKDTGIGIHEKEIDSIFDRFSKADNDKTNVYKGTGLGLAISKYIIEKCGGRIWVESKKNKGSTFFFTLPNKK